MLKNNLLDNVDVITQFIVLSSAQFTVSYRYWITSPRVSTFRASIGLSGCNNSYFVTIFFVANLLELH